MVEVRIRNASDLDKIITVVRDPVEYTIPANGEVIVILDDSTKDSIVLEP